MKMSQFSGIAAAVLGVAAVVCGAQDGAKFESAATACICFAITAVCLFFIYRDHEMMTEVDIQKAWEKEHE